MTVRRLAVTAALLMWVVTASAQQTVPTPEEFLGYSLGARFTPHHRILDYFGELAVRSDLLTLHTFGETYEGRPLVLATITSAKNRAALDSIRANVAALATAGAAEIAGSIPVAEGLMRSEMLTALTERQALMESRAAALASARAIRAKAAVRRAWTNWPCVIQQPSPAVPSRAARGNSRTHQAQMREPSARKK